MLKPPVNADFKHIFSAQAHCHAACLKPDIAEQSALSALKSSEEAQRSSGEEKSNTVHGTWWFNMLHAFKFISDQSSPFWEGKILRLLFGE